MDVLLLAIRLASTGDALEVSLECPQCKHEFAIETSIRGFLANAKQVNMEDTVARISDDVVAYLRPYDFEAKTKLDLSAFEESKLLQHLLNAESSEEEKAKIFNASFEKIAELNLDLLSHCIRYIQIPSGQVDNPDHIRQFIRNADRKVTRIISEKLKELSKTGVDRELDAVCPKEECGHEWKSELVFDPAHFFE
jgi:hypothetical protein